MVIYGTCGLIMQKWSPYVICFVVILIAAAESNASDATELPLTATTVLPEEITPNLCTGSSNTCKEKFCVIDPSFFIGFRCCKNQSCSNSEGRYCPDPGHIKHATRIPDIRKRKYPFRPGESVVYSCVLPYNSGGAMIIRCLSSGKWTSGNPRCVPFITNPNPGKDPVVPKNPTDPPKTPQDKSSTTIAIVVVVVSLCVVIIGIVAWCFWKKCKFGRVYIRARQRSSVVLVNSFNPAPPQPADLQIDAVPAEEFGKYVAIRHNNNDQRFIEEFEEIQNWGLSQLTWEASILSENKDKNRYTNIVAYDHSRVQLHMNRTRQHNLHRGSDYINANYVSSYTKTKAYIACQGPLPSTFNDFWKMVWENNTAIIVMITNLVEKGRRKCDQYWPLDGKEQYKHISVTLKATQAYANFTIRTFSVKNSKLSRRNARSGERRVTQFHFTQWPDHGTPEYLLPVLTFIQRSSVANPTHAGPMVIHCSAGVGRTGTYIVIHSMMQMLQATGRINIKEFLRRIRMQRNHLVQTEDQYVFVHDALLEYIVSGITESSLMQLLPYYQNLIATSNGVMNAPEEGSDEASGDMGNSMLRSGLQKQFVKVVYSRSDFLDSDFAMRSVNERKNRPGGVLPVFRSRVLLCNRTSAEGSDYINASFVQGYRSSHEFIITQLPLANTKNNFWQLIWDHNCPTIITIMDDEWKPDTDIYWPEAEKPLHCSSFNVSFGAETSSPTASEDCEVVIRDFILEATKDDYVLEVKQFQLSNWNKEEPTQAQLNAVSSIVKFTKTKDGSTVVQDRFGSTAATQFACWHLMQCQLDNENTVDVYQTAVVACQMRPRVFTSPLHLKFLYEAILLEAKVRSNPPQKAGAEVEKAVAKEETPNGFRMNSAGSTSDTPSNNTNDASETDCLVG